MRQPVLHRWPKTATILVRADNFIDHSKMKAWTGHAVKLANCKCTDQPVLLNRLVLSMYIVATSKTGFLWYSSVKLRFLSSIR